jgi:phosphatidylserine/phosphatidylglycerophosphate/cardiolipin synthase-like enzyme
MRVDIISGQVWIDVDQPKFDAEYQPTSLILPISFSHVFGDRFSDFSLKIELKFSKIKIGTQILHVELSPGAKSEKHDIEFLLFPELLQLIESERERSRAEDVAWRLEMKGRVRYRSTGGSPMGENPIPSGSFELKTSIAEWKRVLGLTNYGLVLLPRELVEELEDLRAKWGFWKVDDVIAKFLDIYKGEKIGISQQFLVTFYESKTIRDKLAEFAEKSAILREVRVASPYLDNAGAEYLIKMLKNKVRVKILTRKPDKKAHTDALSILNQLGAEIKYDNMLHARLIVFDDIAVIVSSADLDSEGLNNQKQAGILSFDRVVVNDAITFFDKTWELAEAKT